ncbi:restriction endonuclease subunit S [Facklamia sp. P13055]|uniref:restriction endonuclease subunit S n=1 Tax=Facklamia sp. P13055 TaxID=3421952 RepID=UPI003D1730A5
MTRKMKDSGVEWIGEIPSNWNLIKYKKIANSGMGTTLLKSELTDYKTKDSIPVYSATQGSEYFGYTENKNVILEKGDLVIPARGNSIGYIKLVNQIATCTQTTIYSKVYSDKIDVKFLKYCGDGLKDNWFFYDKTAIPQITVNQVNNNLIPFPDLNEQIKIVHKLNILTTNIDNIIKKTQKSIQDLKKYKQSLITEAVTKGIDSNVEMKDSGIEWIGKIPEHWLSLKMKYLGKVRNGLTYKPENILDNSNGTRVLRAGNILQNKLILKDSEDIFVSQDIVSEKLKLKKNDILICSRSGSKDLIGKNILIKNNIEAAFGAFMMVFRTSKVSSRYIYYILNSEIFSYYLGSFLTSTINQLTKSNFDNMKVVITDDINEQQQIVDYLDEKTALIDKLIEDKTKVIEELENYKKSLIYEYVTGKKEA